MTTKPLNIPTPIAKRYWFSDGLTEIGIGLGFWTMGGILATLGLLPFLWLKIMAMPMAGMAVSLFFPRAIGWARERWLPLQRPLTPYYATLRHQLWGAAVILPALVALAIIYARLSGEEASLLSPTLWLTAAGLFFAFVPLALGFSTGVLRFYMLAVPLILLGGLLGQATADLWLAFLAIWFFTGGLFVLSGTAALMRFRQAPNT